MHGKINVTEKLSEPFNLYFYNAGSTNSPTTPTTTTATTPAFPTTSPKM